MIANTIAILIVACMVCLACYLSVGVLRSQQGNHREKETHFFLPNDFFVSLTLLANFWMILLVLLGAQELLPADRNVLVIVASLLAPFLSWWRQKKAGAE